MSLKENINSLHSSLTSKFGEVSILEKSSIEMGNYFEISVKNETKEVSLLIGKKDIENKTFNWSYYSNPLLRDHLVERTSSLDKFTDDVNDIFVNNRFSSDY